MEEPLVKYRVHNESTSYKHAADFIFQDYYVINYFEKYLDSRNSISSSWRMYLNAIWRLINILDLNEDVQAISYLNKILTTDKHIKLYDQATIYHDTEKLISRISNEGVVGFQTWLQELNSILLKWLFYFNLPVTYDFFTYLRNCFITQKSSRALLIGANIDALNFFKQFKNNYFDALGIYDVTNSLSNAVIESYSIELYEKIDFTNFDVFIICSSDRLTDFKIEFELRRIGDELGLSSFPLMRLREWIL
jgi:hypothetical protein